MEALLHDYQTYLKDSRKLSKNTLESYLRDLKQFICYLKDEGIRHPKDVSHTTLLTYCTSLEKKGKAASTIARNVASLRCFYQFLFQQNIMKNNPAEGLEAPRGPKKLPSTLSFEEVDRLLKQPVGKGFKPARDRAMLELLYATGLRII